MNWLAQKFPASQAPRILLRNDLADWFEALKDIRIEKLEWGARYLFAHNRFFPKPVELREASTMAPSSVIPQQAEQIKLAEITPSEIAKKRLNAIFEKLNAQYNTQLKA